MPNHTRDMIHSAQPRPRLTLRALVPRESEVLAGVLHLAQVHPGVAWAMRTNAGAGVMLRPLPGIGGWARLKEQLSVAVAAGCIQESQIGWVRLGPEGCPDIVGMMTSGHGMGLEVKAPGKAATAAQQAAIRNIVEHGGLGAVVYGVEEVNQLFSNWSAQNAKPPR